LLRGGQGGCCREERAAGAGAGYHSSSRDFLRPSWAGVLPRTEDPKGNFWGEGRFFTETRRAGTGRGGGAGCAKLARCQARFLPRPMRASHVRHGAVCMRGWFLSDSGRFVRDLALSQPSPAGSPLSPPGRARGGSRGGPGRPTPSIIVHAFSPTAATLGVRLSLPRVFPLISRQAKNAKGKRQWPRGTGVASLRTFAAWREIVCPRC
jgi:hypothetical protein